MRKTLRFLTTLIILVALVSSICVIIVSAANVSYSASNVTSSVGETVTISVKISSDVEIWGSNVMLSYNSSELQFVSCAKGDAVSSGSLNNTGSSVNFSGMFSKKSGTVFTAKFKVLKSSGKSTLALKSTENIDYDGKTYTCTTANGSVTVIKAVTSVSLNKTSVTLKKGETSQLSATVSPTDATNKTVSYSSSNKNVATVNGNGVITAVGGGTATITAKAGEKTATCKVSVSVPQTGIKVSGNTERTIKTGETLKLSVTKVPADATDNFTTSWSSSDSEVATVSSNGTVTALSPGNVTITAKSNNWTVTYKITVTEKPEESVTGEIPDEETTAYDDITTDPIIDTPPADEPSTAEPIIKDDNVKAEPPISEANLYLMMLATAVVVAFVTVTVTFFVTKGYYSIKYRKKDDTEDNF